VPTASDLRLLGFNVEDQGDVGKCTGEGTSSALECTLKKEGLDVQLAEDYLYYLGRDYEWSFPEDSGCQIRDVVKMAATRGCVLKSQWQGGPTDVPPPSLEEEALKHKATVYYRCPTNDAIKASLGQRFPVVSGLNLPNSFMSDATSRTGECLYHPGEGYAGGHCMLIAGHDDFKKIGPHVGAYLWLNSWGEGFGQTGFVWTPYACRVSDSWTIRKVAL
jgi:C1A family cysteine protease